MALDNYANLRESIKKWSHRDEMDEFSADCIVMAEQEMFYGQVPFRLPEMMSEQISALSTKTLAFPTDCIEIFNVSLEIDGTYHRLQAIPKNKLRDDAETGQPCFYSLTNQLEFDVTPDKSYNLKIEYYQKPNALSDENPTNIILQKYPTAYLFGGLSAAFSYAGEEDKMNSYALRMRDVISKANTDANNFLFGADPVQIIDGGAP